MFPEAQHSPSASLEAGCRLCIAFVVAADLRGPVLRVGLRLNEVFGAATSEVAVDEYGNAGPGEDHVCSMVNVGLHSQVDPVAQPLGMKLPTDQEFGLGVPALVRAHRVPGCGT